MSEPDITASKLISAFLILRDRKSELRKEYEAKEEEIKDKMARVQLELAKIMKQQDTTQLANDEATAFRQIDRKFSCADWTSYWQWIAQEGRFDMVQKRVGEKALSEYLEETGELPPGINVHQEYTIGVRRK